MNKTVMFVTFAALAGLGLVGALVLSIHRPDATATFTGLIVTVLGLVATAAGTFYGLGKVNEKLDEVKTQTNGNLSRRDDKIAEQEAELIELRAAAARATGAHRA
ncbi:hypothetical protein [Rathayibacter sp. SD072]|uniref:hypothetical protein n=1 Tax=Rathayibacter sp. SD072 TaxID=2781731 RepID=UPI001A97A36D|nr:hypothetical protein [Rathayibacter sp. SD072]MBO0983938.1 hypothetical protein [Rathayibacter sp. SD072]